MTTAPTDFDRIAQYDHEGVLVCSDKKTGLRGYIAIHNTVLGPGMGGIRIRTYESEAAALQDVLDLSRAMTYKNACAGLNFGGAKSVIIADSRTQKSPELLKAFAQKINLLQGRYWSASDIGSTAADLDIMREISPYVPCKSREQGGLGDSAPLTSVGVFEGVKATVKVRLGRDDLQGLRVGIEGVGKVGAKLAQYLLEAGCEVTVCDTYAQAAESLATVYPAIKVVTPDELPTLPLDIFSPNSIGGTLTEAIARQLTATMVVGGANNPFATASVGQRLHERDILFAPDFIVNAGGVITIAADIEGRTWEEAEQDSKAIYTTTLEVLTDATQRNVLPLQAAIDRAERRIAGGPNVNAPLLQRA
ncbi:MAG: Glu/Leu/Phe/Val dehydrogenase dimerization domain-containing protein [Vampirovibrionales bacterium]|nr:Glu/Leu/Phe/Val dehydrogenase dimerization domain-containing protein [Vampirovibrionales bacterium]